MASFDSADLLSTFNLLTSRPSVDEVSDATKYAYLAKSQNRVVADIAARAPKVLVGAPIAMTTADNKVFTFGADLSGYPLFPMGNVRIFSSLSCVPDSPLEEGYDYLQEGTQVRIPNNGTYSGTLYWRGISPPADISASVQPSLFPEASRYLIVLEAGRQFMQTLDRQDRHDQLQQDYAHAMGRWLLVWKRQFSNGGALGANTGLRLAMLG